MLEDILPKSEDFPFDGVSISCRYVNDSIQDKNFSKNTLPLDWYTIDYYCFRNVHLICKRYIEMVRLAIWHNYRFSTNGKEFVESVKEIQKIYSRMTELIRLRDDTAIKVILLGTILATAFVSLIEFHSTKIMRDFSNTNACIPSAIYEEFMRINDKIQELNTTMSHGVSNNMHRTLIKLPRRPQSQRVIVDARVHLNIRTFTQYIEYLKEKTCIS